MEKGILAKGAREYIQVGNEDQNSFMECEGANDASKRKLIKMFLKTQKADVFCIQETKMEILF